MRPPRPRRRPWPRAVPFVLAAFVAAGGADAQPSLLHEFIPPDAKDDLHFQATTSDGDLPAAIQTPSGPVPAPDSRKPPPTDHVYSSSTVDDGPESTYEPDRDTRKPNVERYDDPFSPATAPFKRLRAYDSVGPDYTLRVRTRALKSVPVGGALQAGDETFYGDLSVDLVPEEPVRVPTVGPDARILRAHVSPEAQVEFFRDGADNWFVRGKIRGRVRIVEQLAIPRATFGSAFADADWSDLAPHVEPPPIVHQAAFEEVARAIGISRVTMRPREVLTKLVEYHRSFEASDDPPRGRRDIYLDLSLSKKGVCRHRSFAFLVTALYVGIPTRMVVNEAHAWVEVHDGTLWHRIDLGGAAANIETNTDPQRPPHSPPPDPYTWPASQDSGADAASRARQRSPATSASSNPSAAPSASASAGPPSPGSLLSTQDPNRPATEVTVGQIETRVLRGAPMRVLGEVKSGGAPCAHVRVDVLLISAQSPQGAAVGSLSTDDSGNFDGPVVVPSDFHLGNYDLLVSTPGDAQCAPGESQR
jgi:hypothetical protein